METPIQTDQSKRQGQATFNRVVFSSQSVDWTTPRGIYDELNGEFGFDTDPCPLGEREFDGSAPLFFEWKGKRIFCNPPYNRGINKFLERACEADVAVFLLPARTDTRWFHDIVLPNAKEIRFVRGRLTFGQAKNPAPFPSMVVIFHKEACPTANEKVCEPYLNKK